MSVEEIEKVIRLWEYKQITFEQVVGKILLMLQAHHHRLLKLEATPQPPRPPKR